jgi:ssDNA-binding Zn-finger/Zn-ribbon topoisomerase 1
MKCEKCGSMLKLRERLSGDKEGHRYWVCSRFPECDFRKLYAE